MEWNTFVEFSKTMLILVGAIFVGSFVLSFIWLKYNEHKERVK